MRASAGQIVREISKGPVVGVRALDGTLYDGPLSKPAHYVGLRDRRTPVIKMPNARLRFVAGLWM